MRGVKMRKVVTYNHIGLVTENLEKIIDSVSYTHLDVYKRQIQARV